MSEQNEGKFAKRCRLNPVHRWTDMETLEFIAAVVENTKENIESFEKPTAQKFYDKILTPSSHLKSISWSTAKSKMRYLRTSYLSALSWKGNTGAGLLDDGKEKSVEEYINKICPHFDLLQQIFGQRKNINPPVIFQTNDSDEVLNDEESIQISELESDYDNTCSTEQTACSTRTPEPALQQSVLDFTTFKKRMTSRPQKAKTSISNISSLLSLQEKKLELETKRFELEKEKAAREFELEKEKTIKELELKKQKLQQEYAIALEVKKMEIEKEERLKRYELELKYKITQ